MRDLNGDAAQLRVTRIDPALEIHRYTEEVLATAGKGLDAQGRARLEEDLRSRVVIEPGSEAFSPRGRTVSAPSASAHT